MREPPGEWQEKMEDGWKDKEHVLAFDGSFRPEG